MRTELTSAPAVLVVEDDHDLQELVVRNLCAVGFTAYGVSSGRSALASVHATTPDVVVLDVGLPDIPGTSVCEAIRAAHPELPVLMLTARGELGSRMAGFEAGADDYLVKPFALRELAARLKALLRRTRHASMMQGDVQVGDLRCAMSQRRAWLGDSELSLTRREFDLLAKLMSAPGIALSRGTLLDTVWGDELEPASNVVDQYVRRLRSKVGTSRIETIRSVGYRLRKEP